MHNLKNFAQSVSKLREYLETKDVFNADVDLTLWTGGLTAFRINLSYRTEQWSGDREEFVQSLTWDDLEDMPAEDVEAWWSNAILEAEQWIRDIPSREEIEHRAFMTQLGRLIDKGREVGVDVDFLNPLTAMMEKLATNALEDKRNK